MLVTIAQVEAIPVRLPLAGSFATSRGTVASAAAGAEHVYIKVTTTDGQIGWGESRPSRKWSYETHESVTSTINRYFAPALRGLPVDDPERIDRALSAEIAPGFTLGQPIARAGIDLALYDLMGKARGEPVSTLLGGRRSDPIRLSWTVVGHTPETVAESVNAGRERGYHHFNFKLGFGPETDRLIATTIAALAPGAFLWADANQAYDLALATSATRWLADLGVALLEQPLPVNRYLEYPRLRQASALPIGIDEGLYDRVDLEQLIALEALDVFVVKIGRMGGLRRAARAIELAQSNGLTVLASGLTESDLMLAAYAHLLSRYAIDSPSALNGRQFLAAQPVIGLGGDGDLVPVPGGPGLGVTVDEHAVERYRVRLGYD